MTAYSFEPQHDQMDRHITSGIFNSGLMQIVKVACQFGSIIILSRMLSPADFGLMAMVSPISGFVGLFQDLGLAQATIQKPDITHSEVNAFFWVNIFIGTILAALVMILSPLAGWYYHEPRLIPLTAAMGMLIFIGSIGNQPGAILTRRMQFGILAFSGALGAVSGLVATIIFAFFVKGYWALYVGNAVATIVPVLTVCIAVRWMPTAPMRVTGMGTMLKFGAGITSSNVSNYISRNADNVLIGWKWGNLPLGFYDRAYKLLLFPIQQIVGPVMTTMIPVLSRLNDDPQRYRSIFLKTIGQLTLLTWPGIIWSAMLSDTLVPTLLGKQWTDAAPIFVPLAIAALMQIVNSSTGGLFISQARTDEYARWSIFSAATALMAFVIGLPYGAIGVATVYAAVEYLRTPLLWIYLTRKGPLRFIDVFDAILPQIAAGIAASAALLAYKTFIHCAPMIQLAGGFVLSYAVAALSMGLSRGGRQTLAMSLSSIERVLHHIRKIRGKV